MEAEEAMPQTAVLDIPEGSSNDALHTLKLFEIFIRFLDRGCLVRVGCKEIAFESNEEAMAAIHQYVAFPVEEHKRWRSMLG
jgi:hypothetical protein